jgi:hypothetical protein
VENIGFQKVFLPSFRVWTQNTIVLSLAKFDIRIWRGKPITIPLNPGQKLNPHMIQELRLKFDKS